MVNFSSLRNLMPSHHCNFWYTIHNIFGSVNLKTRVEGMPSSGLLVKEYATAISFLMMGFYQGSQVESISLPLNKLFISKIRDIDSAIWKREIRKSSIIFWHYEIIIGCGYCTREAIIPYSRHSR